ncbi:MAG TPA: efflux RND transporter permease subunit, partial [Polyangiaceae bacterium]|nr:efflux RND transporter permease subunit [Polyangiaceae bacterium]
RPKLMTVAAAVLSLAPLLWSEGVGADVTARTAAPLIGGLFGSTFVTLFVTPSLYAIWRHWQFRRRARGGGETAAAPERSLEATART